MKTIHQIAEAAYAAYAKSLARSATKPEPWDDLTPGKHTAWYEAIRQALAEAATAPIAMPTEEVDAEHVIAAPQGPSTIAVDDQESLDTSDADARPYPTWGAP